MSGCLQAPTLNISVEQQETRQRAVFALCGVPISDLFAIYLSRM